MKVILDRRSCTCWQGSCESCFAGNLSREHFCPACLLEEIDDQRPELTVVILDRDHTEKVLVIPDLDFHLHVQPGESAVGGLSALQAGTFEMLCTLPGHAQAGMRGELIVDGSGQ